MNQLEKAVELLKRITQSELTVIKKNNDHEYTTHSTDMEAIKEARKLIESYQSPKTLEELGFNYAKDGLFFTKDGDIVIERTNGKILIENAIGKTQIKKSYLRAILLEMEKQDENT